MSIERVGILTDEVSDNFDDALAWIAEQGMKHVEIRVVNGTNFSALDDAAILDVRKRVDAKGLFVSAVSSPLFKCALDPTRPVASGDKFGQQEEDLAAHFVKLSRVIAIAKMLGTKNIRIFSFWREVDPMAHRGEIVQHLQRAAKIAAEQDILLLLENEPACNGGFADEVADLVRAIDSPALKGLWDPGNEAFGAREAFPAGYSHMKDVLAHVHLKDAYIQRDGTPRCVPLGSGDVKLIAQLRALKADGYKGLFTIETHYTPDSSTRKTGSLMTLNALRTLWKEV